MKLVICKNYDEMSKRGAEIFIRQLKKKPNSVLGMATGSTVVGMYKKLIKENKEGKIDFSRVKTFNLDEYYKISREKEQSFWQTMRRNLFNGINITEENINIPNCQDNIESFCREYEKKIKRAGGIDFQVLGIGHNGHIGFNEPGSSFKSRTRRVDLTESTREANSRFFKSKKDVPRQGITMGIATIMEARKIILFASGKGKAEAVAKAVCGPVTEEVPASILQTHKDVTFIIDTPASHPHL